MHVIFPCGRCLGRGRIVINDIVCQKCLGRGNVTNDSVVEISVPPSRRHDEILQFDHVKVRFRHVFSEGVHADDSGNLVRSERISVIEWLCGFDKFVNFGTIQRRVKTDGAFDLSRPFDAGEGLRLQFQLSLDRMQLKRLQKCTPLFQELFRRKKKGDGGDC